MIKVKYKEPGLKDAAETLLGRSVFTFINEIVADTLVQLDRPTRLMNDMTVVVMPHEKKVTGIAIVKKEKDKRAKGFIELMMQSTPDELEYTLRHETIHLVEPTWGEKKTENKARELSTKDGITI